MTHFKIKKFTWLNGEIKYRIYKRSLFFFIQTKDRGLSTIEEADKVVQNYISEIIISKETVKKY